MQQQATKPDQTTERSGSVSGLPVRFLLVFWVMVLGGIALVDRTNISVAGIEIGRQFHIDNVHLGWVFSAFLLGYAIFQVPGGVLARRYGPRRVITLGVVWWGVFTALTAVTLPGARAALFTLILVRFALGAGEAVMFPAANQFVERWIPIAERGRANGIIFSGVGLGSALAPPLVTAIILRDGWQASFWFCAAIGLVAAAVWYFAARDTPEQHPWVRAAELEHIRSGRGDVTKAVAQAADGGPQTTAIPWRIILHSKEVLALSASYFCYGYVSWIFFSWFYIYLAQVRGLSLKTSALYSTLPFLAMTLGAISGGLASDWLTRHVSARAGRCYLPSFGFVLTAVLLAVGSSAHSASIASLVLAGGAGALYLSQSSFWSVTADCAGQCAGVASGFMNMSGHISGALTAMVTPLIAAHFGWTASFLTASVVATVGAIVWLAVDPEARIASGARHSQNLA
jgi:MFS transporter, ACS family, glucarate transporter